MRSNPLKRRAQHVIAGISLVFVVASCTSSKMDSRVAAEEPSDANVDPVKMLLLNPQQPTTTVPFAIATTTTTIEPTTTTAPPTIAPKTVAPTTVLATTTTPTTAAPATPPPTIAPITLAPTTTKPLSPTTVRVTAPPSTAKPKPALVPVVVVTVPATTRPRRTPTTARPRRAGDSCPPKRLGDTIPAAGQTLTCTRVGKKTKWTVPPAETTTPTSPASVTVPTGPAVVGGFDGKTITITNIGTRLHPAFGPIGRNINGAFTAHFNAINRRGGIGGKYPVKVQFIETNYEVASAQGAYNVSKDKTVGYGSILGTPIVGALLPQLEADGHTAAPASQDAEWAKRPALLPIGTTYQVQAINGASYWWETAGKTETLCGLSIDSAYGATGTEGLKYAAQQTGATLGPIINIGPTETPGNAIRQLAAAGCKAVYLTTTPQQGVQAVVGGAQAGFRPRWIWMSAAWNDAVLTPATGPLLENLSWIVGEGPNYDPVPRQDTPALFKLVTELRANDGAAYVEQANIGTIFGYCQALIWEALLERAVANNDLSCAGISTAAKQIGTVDLNGLLAPADFSATTRSAKAVNTIFKADASYLLGLREVARDYSSPAARDYRK
jgi:ABC-type branched-subunit amino acid transport system substrate-binding protein